MEAQKEVVRANKLASCYIRPIAFYGSEKMGVSPQGRHRARGDRGLALGRLPRRRRPGEGHPRQDLVLCAPPRQRHDVPRQVRRHLRQLDPREPGGDPATATTRRCCSTWTASSPKARARTCSWSRTASMYEPELTSALIGITRDTVIRLARRHRRRGRPPSASPATTSTSPTRPSSPAPPPKSRRSASSTTASSARARAVRSPTRLQSMFFDVVNGALRKASRLAELRLSAHDGRRQDREPSAGDRGHGDGSAAALPDALDAPVERAPARVPADREDRRGAVPLLRHALSPLGRRPSPGTRTSNPPRCAGDA